MAVGFVVSVMLVFAAGVGALVFAAGASAHARVSPPVWVSGKLQLYSLAVPTEKENLTTSKIVMTVPDGFGIVVRPPSCGLDSAGGADRLG